MTGRNDTRDQSGAGHRAKGISGNCQAGGVDRRAVFRGLKIKYQRVSAGLIFCRYGAADQDNVVLGHLRRRI